MKNIINPRAILLAGIIAATALVHSCAKQGATPEPGCEVCTARVDNLTVATQTVCSEEEESEFRNAYSGHSITCVD